VVEKCLLGLPLFLHREYPSKAHDSDDHPYGGKEAAGDRTAPHLCQPGFTLANKLVFWKAIPGAAGPVTKRHAEDFGRV
jgi:hypothetical protein